MRTGHPRVSLGARRSCPRARQPTGCPLRCSSGRRRLRPPQRPQRTTCVPLGRSVAAEGIRGLGANQPVCSRFPGSKALRTIDAAPGDQPGLQLSVGTPIPKLIDEGRCGMNHQLFVLVLAVVAGALAVWTDVRFPKLGPQSMTGVLVNTLAAMIALKLVAGNIGPL